MTSRRISQRDYEALAEVRHLVRRFLAFSDAAARGMRIEPQQHQLLLAVKGLPRGARPTIRTLADRLGIQHNSAVELATRTARAGFVRRRAGATDGREVTLHISPRGERLLEALSRQHRDELAAAAPALVRALRALVGGRAKEKT